MARVLVYWRAPSVRLVPAAGMLTHMGGDFDEPAALGMHRDPTVQISADETTPDEEAQLLSLF